MSIAGRQSLGSELYLTKPKQPRQNKYPMKRCIKYHRCSTYLIHALSLSPPSQLLTKPTMYIQSVNHLVIKTMAYYAVSHNHKSSESYEKDCFGKFLVTYVSSNILCFRRIQSNSNTRNLYLNSPSRADILA